MATVMADPSIQDPTSKVGHLAYAVVPIEVDLALTRLKFRTLGIYLVTEFLGLGETAPPESIDAVFSNGMHAWCDLASRSMETIYVQEDELSGTSLFLANALVPLPGGACHVEVALSVVSDAPSYKEDFVPNGTPTELQILWMSVGPVEVAPLLEAVKNWLALSHLHLDENLLEEPLLPDALLTDALQALHDRVIYRDDVIERLHESTQAKAMRAAAEMYRRTERQLTRHVDQLKTELETQRAVAQRQRERADAAERASRAVSNSNSSAVPVAALPAATSVDPRDADLDHLRLVVRQQSDELDRLRAEAFRLREEAERRGTASHMPTLPAAPGHPSNLHGLASWAQSTLNGRVVVHAKAARAARKSTFADTPLVYRTLEALASLYWPMCFGGDATARNTWESFLASERLSCGPTGAAVNDRRTRASYLVNWQRQQVELDHHLQGDNSRDEARSFRVYFHIDTERQVIVVGHLPSHLPNSFS